MYTIYTLEELNDLCLKVEAGRAPARSSTPRQPRSSENSSRKDGPEAGKTTRERRPKENEPNKDIKCYRCGRWGHISTSCFSKFHSDGRELGTESSKRPMPAGPKSSQSQKSIQVVQHDAQAETKEALVDYAMRLDLLAHSMAIEFRRARNLITRFIGGARAKV